jgi:hypothetical protein
MFWFKRRQRADEASWRTLALSAEALRPHKGEILDECANDVERRSLCLQWAGELRTEWYNGLRTQVLHVLHSDNPRYRHLPPDVRKSIGEQQWSRSVRAKDLAATEQMYSRWAQQYAGGAER